MNPSQKKKKAKLKEQLDRLISKTYSAADAVRNFLEFDIEWAESDGEIEIKDDLSHEMSEVLTAINDLEKAAKRI